MTLDQVKKISLIIRQMRDVMKNFLDKIAELGESALNVLIDDESNPKNLSIPQPSEKRLLNKAQLAERLGVSSRTISNLILYENLPVIRLGKRIQFDYEDVLAWAKAKEFKDYRKNNLRVVK